MKTFTNYILPLLTITLPVVTFFAGQHWQKERLNKELVAKWDEILKLEEQHQKDLQFKYIELVAEHFDEKNLIKAKLIIDVIEDEKVKISFAQLADELLKDNDDKSDSLTEYRNVLANTVFEARKNLKRQEENIYNALEGKSENKKLTPRDSAKLQSSDKQEIIIQNSRFEVYSQFARLLNDFNNKQQVTPEEKKQYLDLHVQITKRFANESLKPELDDLFSALKSNHLDSISKKRITKVIKIIESELNATLWCKEGYFISWKNLRCYVSDLKDDYVFVRISDNKTNKFIEELKMTRGQSDTFDISTGKVALQLDKIDKAGRNFLTKAGYFKFSDLN